MASRTVYLTLKRVYGQTCFDAWRAQGLAKDADMSRMFPSDRRERIELDLNPLPKLITRFTQITDLNKFRRRLNLFGKIRWTRKWSKRMRAWRSRDHVLMLYVHRGFFLTMGVHNWHRFSDLMDLLIDYPDLVRGTDGDPGRIFSQDGRAYA